MKKKLIISAFSAALICFSCGTAYAKGAVVAPHAVPHVAPRVAPAPRVVPAPRVAPKPSPKVAPAPVQERQSSGSRPSNTENSLNKSSSDDNSPTYGAAPYMPLIAHNSSSDDKKDDDSKKEDIKEKAKGILKRNSFIGPLLAILFTAGAIFFLYIGCTKL